MLGGDMKDTLALRHLDRPVAQRSPGLTCNATFKEHDRLSAGQVLLRDLPGDLLARAGLAAHVFVDHEKIELLAERVHAGRERRRAATNDDQVVHMLAPCD